MNYCIVLNYYSKRRGSFIIKKSDRVQTTVKNNINIIRKLERQEEFTEDEIELLKNYSGQNSHPLAKELNTEYYSPDIVTNFIIDILNVNNLQEEKTLCDLSCGIGNMFKFTNNKNLKCFGYEIDLISSKITQLLYPSANIRQCDTIDQINNIPQFDYIIGNPPFGGKLLYKVPWESKKKNQTLDVIFTYLAIEKCKEEGYIGLIVPDGLLSNSSQKKLREYIFQECKLLAVISLPVETFYFSGIGGTGAKTSIILLQKLKVNEKEYIINNNGCKMSNSQKSVFMAVVDEGGLGWDNKGRQTNRCDLEIILEAYKKGCDDIE